MTNLARRALVAAAALTASLLPALLWASEAAGEASRSPVYDLVMKFVNFGILAGILFYFLRKPISQGLADRQQNIRRELEDALEAKEAAEARYREVQEKVANLETEIRRLQDDFRAEAARQRERMLAGAKHAADSIRQQAELAGTTEVKRAIDELRAEAAALAVELAGQKIAGAYTPEDQKKAVETTVHRIEGTH